MTPSGQKQVIEDLAKHEFLSEFTDHRYGNDFIAFTYTHLSNKMSELLNEYCKGKNLAFTVLPTEDRLICVMLCNTTEQAQIDAVIKNRNEKLGIPSSPAVFKNHVLKKLNL